jgi:hypothetical protein
MKFEQGSPACTLMTDKFMKRNLKIQTCEFLDFFQEFHSNLFESLLWFN